MSDTIAAVKGFKPLPSDDDVDPRSLLVKGLSPEIDALYLYYVSWEASGKSIFRWFLGSPFRGDPAETEGKIQVSLNLG